MSTMGLVYDGLGLYAPAQALLEKAFETRTKALGPRPPRTSQGPWASSAQSCGTGETSPRRKTSWSRLWPSTKGGSARNPSLSPSGLHNLGTLNWSWGKYDDARRLLERCLAIREKILGPEHADVAATLNSQRGRSPIGKATSRKPGSSGSVRSRSGKRPWVRIIPIWLRPSTTWPSSILTAGIPTRRAAPRAGSPDPGEGPGPQASRPRLGPHEPGRRPFQKRQRRRGQSHISTGPWPSWRPPAPTIPSWPAFSIDRRRSSSGEGPERGPGDLRAVAALRQRPWVRRTPRWPKA